MRYEVTLGSKDAAYHIKHRVADYRRSHIEMANPRFDASAYIVRIVDGRTLIIPDEKALSLVERIAERIEAPYQTRALEN